MIIEFVKQIPISENSNNKLSITIKSFYNQRIIFLG